MSPAASPRKAPIALVPRPAFARRKRARSGASMPGNLSDKAAATMAPASSISQPKNGPWLGSRSRSAKPARSAGISAPAARMGFRLSVMAEAALDSISIVPDVIMSPELSGAAAGVELPWSAARAAQPGPAISNRATARIRSLARSLRPGRRPMRPAVLFNVYCLYLPSTICEPYPTFERRTTDNPWAARGKPTLRSRPKRCVRGTGYRPEKIRVGDRHDRHLRDPVRDRPVPGRSLRGIRPQMDGHHTQMRRQPAWLLHAP